MAARGLKVLCARGAGRPHGPFWPLPTPTFSEAAGLREGIWLCLPLVVNVQVCAWSHSVNGQHLVTDQCVNVEKLSLVLTREAELGHTGKSPRPRNFQ